jgi:hypothetical protein
MPVGAMGVPVGTLVTNIQSIPNIPSFLPAKINFYNRFTGAPEGIYDSQDNIYITSNYTCGGVNVNISGSRKDVEKVLEKLGSDNIKNVLKKSPQNSHEPLELYPMDVPTPKDVLKNIKNNKYFEDSSGNCIWYYTINPRNKLKVLLNNKSTKKIFSGSGVIFFENQYQAGGKNVSTILLAKTKRGIYEEFGGQLERDIQPDENTLKDNARKEVAEESQSLFMIEKLDLEKKIGNTYRYLDIPDHSNNAIYRCYFVCISGTESIELDKVFEYNRDVTVNLMNLGGDYEETVELSRFSMREVQNNIRMYNSGEFYCRDINNHDCRIRDRTANCLRVLLNTANSSLISTVFDNCIKVQQTKVAHVTFSQTRFIL